MLTINDMHETRLSHMPEVVMLLAPSRVMENDPPAFWAAVSGAGRALARHIMDSPELVCDRPVYDFGAGAGALGLAALKAKASHVTFVDTDAAALTACASNVAINFPNAPASFATSCTPKKGDVVLTSCTGYTPDNVTQLWAFAEAGATVLAAEIGVYSLPVPPWELVSSQPYRTEMGQDTEVRFYTPFVLSIAQQIG